MSEPVTLDTCDREPIHIPGSIQPHGVLFALDGDRVARASTSVRDHLGVTVDEVLGRSIFELVDGPELRAALAHDAPPREVNPMTVSRGSSTFDAVVHRSPSGSIIVELEPHDTARATAAGFDHRLRTSVMQLQRASDLASLTQLAADQVRELTSFDRVMVYRFDRDWNGEVVAESRRHDLEPFLGLHYPASDIPAQARHLYTLNWLRFIVDVEYTPSPILPPRADPLDLSFASLRSVSPIHIEYLRNMGVRASMSVSLIVDGKLAGLIACHHYSGAKLVPYRMRDTVEFLGQALSWQLRALEAAAAAERARSLVAREAEIVRSIATSNDFLEGIATPALTALTESSGAAVVLSEGRRAVGACPSSAELRAVLEYVRAEGRDLVVTDRLPDALPELGDAFAERFAGLLAVAISRELGEYILWFRPPTEWTVDWAGDPRKVESASEGQPPRLSPRGSFALWRETVRGRSLPWEPWHVEAASALRKALLGGVRLRANELRTLNERLLEADRAKDDFIAVVSHELRTPLNAIVGWNHLLAGGELPRDKHGHAHEVIMRNAKTLTDLVDDLLDVSRMVGGKLSLDVAEVDLVTLVTDVVEGFSVAATAKEIRIKRVLDSSAGPVLGDATRLRQVVANLLSNALKFTPKGGSVTVALRRAESDVALSVTDTGTGIAPDLLPLVFDLFRQGDTGMNRRARGLGIGLAIARKIVELHGGRILAESDGADRGSTFRVRIPMAPVRNGDRARTPPRGTPVRGLLSSIRCLVVDDDNDARELVAMVLGADGATVATAENVQAALALIAAEQFDVLVSDVGMPDQDGYALIRAVRARSPGEGGALPAVALTAYSRTHDRMRTLHAGFNAHVPKPVDAMELVAVVASLSGRLGKPR